MKKLLGKSIRFLFVIFLIFLGIIVAKTIAFSSRQIAVQAIEPFPVSEEAAKRFSKIIQQPTISIGSQIDTFALLSLDSILNKTYPLVDSLLEDISVHPYSKLLKWPGSNVSLAPILLLSHSDVVPVEPVTIDEWNYPPFEGKIADGYIWGRGTLDIKCTLFGILEALEGLLQEGYMPNRSIYIAIGHDEEIGGDGAKGIAAYFEKEDIQFEYLLDEGFYVVENALNGLEEPLALIGVAEKGYITLNLTAQLENGGHSSMPPDETAVGMIATALEKLRRYPFPAKIDGASKGLFEYVGPEMSLPYKALFANMWLTKGIIKSTLSADPPTNAVIRTTIAPTMLRAGVKDNVLPARASVKINFRILPGEDKQSVIDYVRKTIDNEQVIITVSRPEQSANPSVVSGTNTLGYRIIQRSIQEVFPDVVVAPSLSMVTTDSRHFRNVCNNIYRFAPVQIDKEEVKKVHGTNERLSIENLANSIRFYRRLIENSCR